LDPNTTTPILTQGQQLDPRSHYAYTPIRLDPLYGLAPVYDIPRGAVGSAIGRGTTPANLSVTGMVGRLAVQALERLGTKSKSADAPFVLTASFSSPHPPMISTQEYIDYYWNQRDQLFIPPSNDDLLLNSAFKPLQSKADNYEKDAWLQEMIAVYYSLVEEVDDWIGTLMAKLSELGIENDTMVIFTADHGTMGYPG
jgi:hypothetical protein